jgi:hypothetical protein
MECLKIIFKRRANSPINWHKASPKAIITDIWPDKGPGFKNRKTNSLHQNGPSASWTWLKRLRKVTYIPGSK